MSLFSTHPETLAPHLAAAARSCFTDITCNTSCGQGGPSALVAAAAGVAGGSVLHGPPSILQGPPADWR
eukprot:CAMPEP_0204284382 /NCGR_PEP_ID=MMETSP0468-20130131/48408_1 /ASSEMBLY_ACC=CAM_ASM_000383 /TAXON_ID=2969 /ORGANISM="Oxyrrhis marina" /LENGTH=68 /DNA_ID=CAMNT_0051262107 /DNA_START=37 /DNA_END=240 /DNA_ORIENTATION=+